ncbi:DUF1510 family protein [Bacillus sp. FJAT-42376]|uniref:YrrS family protein n=1 Tax=Bacillus sp. FJAT-42376 TaxID=2014076 RepID=UPI000F503F99|nr:YrrS family protein [Bacillus sp. FJAT-42376]AZB43712.1 DUF1510 family protein [Bacillus sp. FJAT-42376]
MNKTRYGNRDKRRKTNIVLNVLIGVVLILIVAVGSQLILGGDKKQSSSSKVSDQQTREEQTNQETASAQAEKENTDSQNTDDQQSEEAKPEDEEEQPAEPAQEDKAKEEGTEKSKWEPVGTEQKGEHTTVYDKGSADWKEMTKAMSAATGIPEDNMTIWFLGNNGSPNDAKGTISPKNSSEKYQVTLRFIENEGWKPLTVNKVN